MAMSPRALKARPQGQPRRWIGARARAPCLALAVRMPAPFGGDLQEGTDFGSAPHGLVDRRKALAQSICPTENRFYFAWNPPPIA